LAAALKENSTLTSLDLKVNALGEDGALALLAALEQNSGLISLDLEVVQLPHSSGTMNDGWPAEQQHWLCRNGRSAMIAGPVSEPSLHLRNAPVSCP